LIRAEASREDLEVLGYFNTILVNGKCRKGKEGNTGTKGKKGRCLTLFALLERVGKERRRVLSVFVRRFCPLASASASANSVEAGKGSKR
jgi:hypothetical protein